MSFINSIFNSSNIKNVKSVLGADIQWFFDSLNSKYKKIDSNNSSRFDSFVGLNGDLINGAKFMLEKRRFYNGPIMNKKGSDLNDKEVIIILSENLSKQKYFSKDFYNTINKIVIKWHCDVLLSDTPSERLFGSSLRDKEIIEMKFYENLDAYYNFILETYGAFIFADDATAPIDNTYVDKYNELATNMRLSASQYAKFSRNM